MHPRQFDHTDRGHTHRDRTAVAANCDRSITAINAEQMQQGCMTEIYALLHKFLAHCLPQSFRSHRQHAIFDDQSWKPLNILAVRINHWIFSALNGHMPT
jgi:hypothetical protein